MRETGGDKLGVFVQDYLSNRQREFKKNATVVDNWRELLPGQLRENCSIESISGGVMKVAVEPGPYMHELGLMSSELIRCLQQISPGSGVTKIKLVPRRAGKPIMEQEP